MRNEIETGRGELADIIHAAEDAMKDELLSLPASKNNIQGEKVFQDRGVFASLILEIKDPFQGRKIGKFSDFAGYFELGFRILITNAMPVV